MCLLIIYILFIVLFDVTGDSSPKPLRNVSRSRSRSRNMCGIDNSPVPVVYEGRAKIETYPWLGTLMYPLRDKLLTTAVVLVSKQIAIASALDIDKVPKIDFRSRSRVVIGTTCTGPAVRVKDYSYHPNFARTTVSAPAILQLDYDLSILRFRPICAPPASLNNAQFYAMTLSNDCKSPIVRLHEMVYVDVEKCKDFYRRAELDIETIWPSHVVCARATIGKGCLWKNGAILALRQNYRWSLVGIGIAGPGCHATARFMDYTRYRPWLKNSLLRIGKPAISRIGENQIVMRRSLSNVQRFGPCDPEEVKGELYTDTTSVLHLHSPKQQKANYNFTIFANYEYSCIVFKVQHVTKRSKEKPKIRLTRWCMSPKIICYSMRFLQVDFYVEIFFKESVTYKVSVYGKEIKLIDIRRATAYFNSKKKYPEVPFVDMPINVTGRK